MSKFDQFYDHEALDRTSMIAGMIDEYLSCHPAIQMRPKVRAKITEASNALSAAYNLLAADTLEVGSHD